MINYAQLKTELQTDPTGRGYAPHLANGNHDQCAFLLNEVLQTIDINRDLVPAYEVFNAIVPAEMDALTDKQRDNIWMILTLLQVMVNGTNTRDTFLAAFPAGSGSRTALGALQKRKGSRGEQLFGSGTNILASDIAIALRS